MPDTRTRRQKLQEFLGKATTPGERAAVQAALDRLGPDPDPPLPPHVDPSRYARARGPRTYVSYEDQIQWDADEVIWTWDGQWSPPTGKDARPAGRQTRTREHIERMQAEFDQMAEEMGARFIRVKPKLYEDYTAGKISWTEFIDQSLRGRR